MPPQSILLSQILRVYITSLLAIWSALYSELEAARVIWKAFFWRTVTPAKVHWRRCNHFSVSHLGKVRGKASPSNTPSCPVERRWSPCMACFYHWKDRRSQPSCGHILILIFRTIEAKQRKAPQRPVHEGLQHTTVNMLPRVLPKHAIAPRASIGC
jgi:hypothetical protein